MKDTSSGYPLQDWRWGPYAPAAWLLMAWAVMVGSLYWAGYLNADLGTDAGLHRLLDLLCEPPVDVAARRGARALAGVALAATVLLAATSLVWAGAAYLKASPTFRNRALAAAVGVVIACAVASAWVSAHLQPFSSVLGNMLLSPFTSSTPAERALQGGNGTVPIFMFVLACVVPGFLLAGATFLQQPMEGVEAAAQRLKTWKERVRAHQWAILADRLKELDQMLYIGALALVFGTLQLSAGLSVPLASLPKAADLKVQADLCKLMAPAASAPMFVRPEAASSEPGQALDRHCQDLPQQFLQLEPADSLRQLVRGITLGFGLAFSVLLAAIYIPSQVGLRLMLEERLPGGGHAGAADARKDLEAADPVHRVAAALATLGPLLAGLLANTVAAG